jgi:hypothetical protein
MTELSRGRVGRRPGVAVSSGTDGAKPTDPPCVVSQLIVAYQRAAQHRLEALCVCACARVSRRGETSEGVGRPKSETRPSDPKRNPFSAAPRFVAVVASSRQKAKRARRANRRWANRRACVGRRYLAGRGSRKHVLHTPSARVGGGGGRQNTTRQSVVGLAPTLGIRCDGVSGQPRCTWMCRRL